MRLVKFTQIEVLFLAGVLLASLFVLGFIRLNLTQTSNQAVEQFAQQNRFELAAGDTMQLATKLNALMASDGVQCIFGSYDGRIFVDAKKGFCGSGVLTEKVAFEDVPVTNLKINITYVMPRPLIFSAFTLLLAQIFSILFFFKLYRDRIAISNQAKEKLVEIASQVAHDIRSPLSAMNIAIAKMNGLDQESREILSSVSGRISQIANDLLERSKGRVISNPKDLKSEPREANVQGVPLAPLVRQLVHEKKIEHEQNSGVDIVIDFDINSSVQVFGVASDIQRIVSNLINNSVDASNAKEINVITVSIRNYDDITELTIGDTGKGIPEDVLGKLGSRGYSFGKESGNGLGIYDAKLKIESWHGRINILSKVNHGTLITLTFKNFNQAY